MQKIQSSVPTLAPPARIERWRHVLRGCLCESPRPVSAGGGRGVILRALQAAVDPATEWPASPIAIIPLPATATNGLAVATAVWSNLAAAVRSDTRDNDAVRRAIAQLAPTAIAATVDDNPEPWWQQEMMILHALHSFALRQNDLALIEKTLAQTTYHLAEIQPDHATNEPWAVHAYASHVDGNVTAETLLHAAYMNGGGVLSDTSRWILADALAALDAIESGA